jgi:hypothetical protein
LPSFSPWSTTNGASKINEFGLSPFSRADR